MGARWLKEGLFGIVALRPQALLGTELAPLIHGVLWSLSLNVLTYVVLSLLRQPTSIERVQADLFVPNELAPMAPNFRRWRTTVTVQDLLTTVAQYLGPERTRQSFETFAATNRISLDRSAPADFLLLRHAEHLIASAIGAASSRLVLSLLLRKRTVSAKAALKLLDDAHAALHFNREMLQTALNHVRQGIAVFNPELHSSLEPQFARSSTCRAVHPDRHSLGEIVEFIGGNNRSPAGGTDEAHGAAARRLYREGGLLERRPTATR